MGDRYGKLPEAANTLIETHRLRLYCEAIGISRIEATDSVFVISFIEKPHFEPMRLIEMLQKSRNMRMISGTKLKIDFSTETIDARLSYLRGVMRQLDGGKNE